MDNRLYRFSKSAVTLEKNSSIKRRGYNTISDSASVEKALLNVLANTEPFEVINARTGETYMCNSNFQEKMRIK